MEYDYATASPGSDSLASPVPLDEQPEPIDNIHAAFAPASMAATPTFYPRKGTWFDEAVDFRDPEGDAITKDVVALIAAVEERERKRRPIDEANHHIIVRKILANGFRCHRHRRPALVAYCRKAASYKDGPAWLSGKAMRRTVDLLVKVGFLDASLGEWGTAASTYAVTQTLCESSRQHGISDSSLSLRLPSERLVRLYKTNSEGLLIDFRPTDDTHRWTALLDAYNAFLAQQDVALALSAEEEVGWTKHWNRNRSRSGMPFYRPELIQTDLYRQFNNSSFEQGGRLYGGWWITAPKVLRKKITVNGQPTVELDFSGCAIRMLYHERGLDYEGDPYRLEAIAAYEKEAGLTPDHFRDGIKAMMQALINDRSGGKPERIPLPNGLSFRPRFKRADVRRMIEEKHTPIADAFGTGAGLRLQRRDSDLALAIITELMKQGIVALPIHDSFITAAENRDKLINEMEKSYRNMFNFYPLIK